MSGVSAIGLYQQKAWYSSYGLGAIDLTAPGGDGWFQNPDPTFTDPDAFPYGLVLSTFPGSGYELGAGTSMATPHVVGVVALMISKYGILSPGKVLAILKQTAQSMPCPPNPFDPGGTGEFIATCEGSQEFNGFYGFGLVNAYQAVNLR